MPNLSPTHSRQPQQSPRPDPKELTTMATMTPAQIADVLNRPYAQELIASRIPARIAYTALDGTPRVIPCNYLWNGSAVVLASAATSPKVSALRANPRVAISIDSEP